MRPQEKLKLVMTPIWDKEMGQRLCLARLHMLRRQEDLAAILSTPGRRVHQQQIGAVENGRLDRLNVTWARLEAVFGKHLGYVLIGSNAALYDRDAICDRAFDYFERAMRKRNGLDPKKGETPPWPRTAYSRPLPPRKRGSTR